jgi:hypothetical protein
MIKKIVLKIGKKTIELSPKEFDELRNDILSMKPIIPNYPYWYTTTASTGHDVAAYTTTNATGSVLKIDYSKEQGCTIS